MKAGYAPYAQNDVASCTVRQDEAECGNPLENTKDEIQVSRNDEVQTPARLIYDFMEK